MEREATVEALVAFGLPEDEARRAVDEDRVALALAQRALEGERKHSLADVAEAAGVPERVLVEIDRSFGVAPRQAYTDREISDARYVAVLLEHFDEEKVVEAVRRDAASLRQLALADLQFVRDEIVRPIREAGGTDLDVAAAAGGLAESALDAIEHLIGAGYRRTLVQLLATEIVVEAVRGGPALDLAVGFVDVVGYTSLSARVDPSGLEEILEGFEDRCRDVVAGRQDVHFVKFLGDAAMYVAADPTALAGVLLDLVDPGTEDDDTPLSAGLAFGAVVTRGGDYYGKTVNTAARLTDVARPGSVVGAEDLADRFADEFELSRLPSTKLSGIGRSRPVRVRRQR